MLNLANPLAPLIIGPGLNITVNSGVVFLNGSAVTVPQTVVNLTASSTSFVFVTAAGVTTSNTTGFPAGSLPVAQVLTGSSTIMSLVDSRPDFIVPGGVMLGSTPSYFDEPNLNYVIGGSKPANIVIGSGQKNICFGDGCLQSLTTGQFNYCFGHSCLHALTTGVGNACFGDACLSGATTTNNPSAPQAGGNFCLGDSCLQNVTTGAVNTAIGNAGGNITTGFGNNLQGSLAGASLVDGTYNDAMGYSALANAVHVSFQNAVGYFSLAQCNKQPTDNTNACVNNNAFGKATLQLLTTGHDNTAMGDSVLGSETTGSGSTGVGSQALVNAAGGGANTAVGNGACSNVTNGQFNTCIGQNAQVPAGASQTACIGRGCSLPSGITSNWIQIGALNEFVGADMFVSTAVGTAQSISGCSLSAASGGRTSGVFTSGTTGTCTVTVALPTAPHGWFCDGNDVTAGHLAKFIQQGNSTTQCVLTATTTSGDSVTWLAQAF